MQLSSLFTMLLVSSQLPTIYTQSSRCSYLIQRKEIRQLTPSEFQAYSNAAYRLHTIRDQRGETFAELLSRIHVTYFQRIHNSAFFLPWHRFMLKLYELKLRQYDPNVTLPYWDWSIDYSYPDRSIVLSREYLGGNGDQLRGGCVNEGVFRGLTSNFPRYHCVRRDYDRGDYISPLSPTQDLDILLNESQFSEFSKQLEVLHGELHSSIGGDMKQRYSNNDPLFYLHHSFMDTLYNEWLRRHPNSRFESDAFRFDVDLDTKLIGFDGYVRDMINSRFPPLCYTTPRFPTNLDGDSANGRSFGDVITKIVVGNKTLDELIDSYEKETSSEKLKELEEISKSQAKDLYSDKGKSRAIFLPNMLPPVKPISDEWIINNGFTVEEVREMERKRNLFRQIINRKRALSSD